MRYLSYTAIVISYLSLIGYVIYLTESPWWILMSLFIGSIPTESNKEDKEEN
jgi:hypothetical protein